jgi:hypothetical protein
VRPFFVDAAAEHEFTLNRAADFDDPVRDQELVVRKQPANAVEEPAPQRGRGRLG